MKKVLVISYYFPPSGGPGVQRVLKFVKFLREYNWEPVVLTVKDADFPARDESLLDEIPDDVKVYRTKIFEPYGFYRKLTGRKKREAIDVDNIPKAGKEDLREKLAEFIRATFFIPDARRGWLKYAVKEGKKIIDAEKPGLIFSSSPPYTCALIAMKLKEYSGLPWVSDFRDAWTGYLTSPKRWFVPAMIDRRYERETLEKADAVTMVARGIKEDFERKYPGVSRDKKYVLIRNGYDGEDFGNLSADQKENNPLTPPLLRGNYTMEKFTIVYTGSMYGKRNPYFFLEMLHKTAIESNRVRIIFAGRMGGEIRDYIEKCPLRDSIEIIPYLPHSESVKLLMKADVMLLLIDEDKYSKMILSGKLFEYLGACALTGKPVLAVAPEGEAAEVIRETGAGIVISQNSEGRRKKEEGRSKKEEERSQNSEGRRKNENLKEVLIKLYNSFLENKQTFYGKKGEIRKYERRELTGKLAEVFKLIIDN